MIAEIERSQCKPSGFAEYDGLTGYIERVRTIVGMTLDGWKVRRTITVINLGRPDRGAPVDPDAAMEDDRTMFKDEGAQLSEAWRAKREKKIATDAILVERLRDGFATYGPMISALMAAKLNLKQARVIDLLQSRPDVFQCFGGSARAWGLLDQEYTHVVKKKVTPLMLAIRDLMLEQGPMTSAAVADALGKMPTSVHNSLKNHDDWFVGVGTQPMQGNRPASRIWGLVGVHDKGSA